MSGANFYEILGTQRSASSDEIRAAFRELVKRHHPDLFPAAAEKQQATEKLRIINEAYATLGNPQRRREYDQTLTQENKGPPPRASRRSRSGARPQGKQAPPPRKKKRRNPWEALSKRRLLYGLGGLAAALLLIYAARSEPRWTTAWTLVQKVEISPAAGNASAQASGTNWSQLAQFEAVADCTAALKEKVREDEREGSKAVFDERSGMMAITVYLKKASARAAGTANSNTGSEQSVNSIDESAGAQTASPQGTAVLDEAVKRVRNLECRATRRLETESWAQRTLRNMGLSF